MPQSSPLIHSCISFSPPVLRSFRASPAGLPRGVSVALPAGCSCGGCGVVVGTGGEGKDTPCVTDAAPSTVVPLWANVPRAGTTNHVHGQRLTARGHRFLTTTDLASEHHSGDWALKFHRVCSSLSLEILVYVVSGWKQNGGKCPALGY